MLIYQGLLNISLKYIYVAITRGNAFLKIKLSKFKYNEETKKMYCVTLKFKNAGNYTLKMRVYTLKFA